MERETALVKMSKSLAQRLKIQAAKEGISMRLWLDHHVEKVLSRLEKKA